MKKFDMNYIDNHNSIFNPITNNQFINNNLRGQKLLSKQLVKIKIY